MESSKLSAAIILFVFISFTVAQEFYTAVVDNENKLKLECENDTTIHFLVSKNIWTDAFYVNCPNRSYWDSLGFSVGIFAKCQLKENCSLDLTNVTITNCTDYKNYLNINYTCNITETKTDITTTTTESQPDDDDDDSEEDGTTTTTTTTTTKKPPKMEPKYLPLPVPALLTTKKPTPKPLHNPFPQPLLPLPGLSPFPQLPPLFGGGFNRNYGGGGFNMPIILPLPLPLPAPVPLFG